MKTAKTIYKSATPCYIADSDESNPYREYLALHTLGDDRYFWIEDDGNGCAGGYAVEDIDGWSDADINEIYRNIDTSVIAADVERLREMGYTADADWLWDWLSHVDSARCTGDPCHAHNLTIEVDLLGSDADEADIDNLIEALHAEGYTWARRATDGERGDTSGITDREWQRIMDSVFNA